MVALLQRADRPVDLEEVKSLQRALLMVSRAFGCRSFTSMEGMSLCFPENTLQKIWIEVVE